MGRRNLIPGGDVLQLSTYSLSNTHRTPGHTLGTLATSETNQGLFNIAESKYTENIFLSTGFVKFGNKKPNIAINMSSLLYLVYHDSEDSLWTVLYTYTQLVTISTPYTITTPHTPIHHHHT